MPALYDEQPSVVLAVYAHPDDPEASCGGSLAKWSRGGAAVHVCLACDGEKAVEGEGLPDEEVAVKRRGEVAEAAELLGVASTTWLGHPDGSLSDGEALLREVAVIVRRTRPDVVVCPDPTAVIFGDGYVNHRDHRIIGTAAVDAVNHVAGNGRYYPDAGPPHEVPVLLLSGTLVPTIFVDVTSTIDVKVQAMARHEIQIGDGFEWTAEWMPLQAADCGRLAGVPYAEAFRLVHLA